MNAAGGGRLEAGSKHSTHMQPHTRRHTHTTHTPAVVGPIPYKTSILYTPPLQLPLCTHHPPHPTHTHPVTTPCTHPNHTHPAAAQPPANPSLGPRPPAPPRTHPAAEARTTQASVAAATPPSSCGQGTCSSAACASAAKATASRGRWKARMNESPSVALS